MGINTTGIQTDVNCARPNQLSLTPTSNLNNSIISATSIDGCSVQLSLNPNDADQQYGVVNVPNCGTSTTNVAFQPVRQPFSSSLGCEDDIHPVLSRFSSGFGNRTRTIRPPFSVNLAYSFST
jgi:hypothetical protein